MIYGRGNTEKGKVAVDSRGANRKEQMISVHVMKSLPFGGQPINSPVCLSLVPLLFISSPPTPALLFRSVAVF